MNYAEWEKEINKFAESEKNCWKGNIYARFFKMSRSLPDGKKFILSKGYNITHMFGQLICSFSLLELKIYMSIEHLKCVC